jgi:small-conductance mechanosensitive channel
MTLRAILSGTANWLRARRYEESGQCEPALDDDGLLVMHSDPDEDLRDVSSVEARDEPVVVRAVASVERREPVERLQDGLNQLVGQLQRINEHLSQQLAQHEDLMGRVGQLPQLLESLPSAVGDQKRLTAQLLEHLQSTAAKDRQFTEVIGQIPTASARQTDALIEINHQLAASADIDVQMAQSFNKFRATVDRLSQSTAGNTEGILQMSRTFAASDRYLKYVVAGLNRRYAWTLAVALTVCTAVVASLIGVVLYLAR